MRPNELWTCPHDKLASCNQFSNISIMEMGKTWCSGAGAPSPSGFSFFCFSYKQVLLWVVEGFTAIGTLDLKISVEGFTAIGTSDLKKSYHHSEPSPMRPNELWTCPDDGIARAQAPGCQRSSCWVRSKRKRRGPVYPAT